jgi:flagellar motility protein MotE (MotC chaperone)
MKETRLLSSVRAVCLIGISMMAVTTLPAFATETVRQVLPGGQDAAQPQQLARETSPADAPGPQVQESDVERFCSNIADAARDRRYALQAAELKQLQDEVDKRIKALEDKRSEYESWLKRREVFLARAQEGVVKIYADMKPDAAAERLAAVNAELAAAILMKLEPRKAGVILNEMDTKAAATLTGIMASAARRVDPS